MLNFTTVGRHLTEVRQAELAQVFAALNWVEYVPGTKLSFATGEVIREAMQTLPGGALTHFAESNKLAPFAVVAIRRSGFKGGPVNIYLADEGSQAVVLASEQISPAPAKAA